MTKRILVTGGAGYVGSHACLVLAEAGFEPVVYDNLSHGHRGAVQWGPLVKGDVRDTARLAATLRDHRIEAVMHFAALTDVAESMTDPRAYYDNNVGGSLSVLAAMHEADVATLIFSSTCSIFANTNQPIAEDDPKEPISPYGASKMMVERCLSDYGAACGLRWTALRYFNAAGADAAGRIGENHDPETHLIPRLIDAALGRLDSVTIFGSDYPTADGTCVRDYVHVGDLAVAHVQALARLERGEPSTAFNLGSGRGHSVLEIIRSVERVTGRPVPHIVGPRRAGDPPILVAARGRACRDLDWTPHQSELDHLVATALAWRGTRR